MVVYRADPLDLKEMDVDVTKKSGKDLGLGFAECKGHGIYITEIVNCSIDLYFLIVLPLTINLFSSFFAADARRNY